jgi:hypothetical protein
MPFTASWQAFYAASDRRMQEWCQWRKISVATYSDGPKAIEFRRTGQAPPKSCSDRQMALHNFRREFADISFGDDPAGIKDGKPLRDSRTKSRFCSTRSTVRSRSLGMR